MRKYSDKKNEDLVKVSCNCCGKEIRVENGIAREGAARLDIPWGYFSDMDGETHHIDVCEDCYRKWIRNFVIPVEVEEQIELL